MSSPPDSAPPRVSVAMVVRRPDPGLFREAVHSVLAQTLTDLELVVVETPSECDARAMLAEHGDARIRHLTVPSGTALARARNESIAFARAPLVALLDADDVAEPKRLESQAAFLDAHPDVGVVGTAIRIVRADGAVIGVRRYPESDADIRRAMRRFNPIAQPAVMVRRATLRDAGGYADRPDGICEDYDLWCRMAKAGVRFANLREPLTRYRIHDDSMKATHLRGTLRDTIRIKREHFGPELDLGDRVRILGERTLACLPAGLVRALFLRSSVEREGR